MRLAKNLPAFLTKTTEQPNPSESSIRRSAQAASSPSSAIVEPMKTMSSQLLPDLIISSRVISGDLTIISASASILTERIRSERFFSVPFVSPVFIGTDPDADHI